MDVWRMLINRSMKALQFGGNSDDEHTMNKIPKYKIGLRNRTIAERFSICGSFVDAVIKAPAEKRQGVNMEKLESNRAAAEASHREIQQLQTELNAAITRRNQE